MPACLREHSSCEQRAHAAPALVEKAHDHREVGDICIGSRYQLTEPPSMLERVVVFSYWAVQWLFITIAGFFEAASPVHALAVSALLLPIPVSSFAIVYGTTGRSMSIGPDGVDVVVHRWRTRHFDFADDLRFADHPWVHDRSDRYDIAPLVLHYRSCRRYEITDRHEWPRIFDFPTTPDAISYLNNHLDTFARDHRPWMASPVGPRSSRLPRSPSPRSGPTARPGRHPLKSASPPPGLRRIGSPVPMAPTAGCGSSARGRGSLLQAGEHRPRWLGVWFDSLSPSRGEGHGPW